MARQPRFFVQGQAQHIIHRGNNRRSIFYASKDYNFYLKCLQEACQKHDFELHAYVLMTNHVHLLGTPQLKNSVSKVLQSIGRRYVQYFNYTYRCTGTLWEGRYRATLIDTEQYLLICMRYIELNPVRAGLVDYPGDYQWSSYSANALGKCNPLITSHDIYKGLGEDPSSCQKYYRQLFSLLVDERQHHAIRQSTNKAWVLGNLDFQQKVQKLTGRQPSPKSKGRPSKKQV